MNRKMIQELLKIAEAEDRFGAGVRPITTISAHASLLRALLEPDEVSDVRPNQRPHINADGLFQSDKYPTCPAGKVPLSVKDKAAQDLLWTYAQRRREVDAEFANDLETCLTSAGYDNGEVGYVATLDRRETDFSPAWTKYPKLRTAFQNDATLLVEFLPLLREARADAVRLIKDANGEELRKARSEGVEHGRVNAIVDAVEAGAVNLLEEEVRRLSEEGAKLQVRCESLQRELDADTGIIQSHIVLRTKAETERDHARLIVACAWRVHHGGYIEDVKQDLYRTLVRYAPDGDLPATADTPAGRTSHPCVCGHSKASHFSMSDHCLCAVGGERCYCDMFRTPGTVGTWEHCSPELLATGVNCGRTKRRACVCDQVGSHDHWVERPAQEGGDHKVSESHEGDAPQEDGAAPGSTEVEEPPPEVFRFRITIRDTAGHIVNGKPEAIVASRGRVFYINDETIAGATAKFCKAGIAATDRLPASRIILADFDIVPADQSDIPEKAIENWTRARPG